MGLVNMLLQLPAGKQILALSPEQNAPIEATMRQLREQAEKKALQFANRLVVDNEAICHWRLVASYAKFMARAIKRENEIRAKSELTQNLIGDIGIDRDTNHRRVNQLVGSKGFNPPPANESSCLFQAVDITLDPWVSLGDYIQVDFTLRRLTIDGLYLVSVYGGYLAICGFNRTRDGWYVHESRDGPPRLIQMREDRCPNEFEIIGLILKVFKGV